MTSNAVVDNWFAFLETVPETLQLEGVLNAVIFWLKFRSLENRILVMEWPLLNLQ